MISEEEIIGQNLPTAEEKQASQKSGTVSRKRGGFGTKRESPMKAKTRLTFSEVGGESLIQIIGIRAP